MRGECRRRSEFARYCLRSSAIGLYKHLIVLIPRPYDFGRLLELRRFQHRNGFHPQLLDRRSEESTMHLTILNVSFLISVGLALAFMLWVLWSLTEQLANRTESNSDRPMISIGIGDRYLRTRQSSQMPRTESTGRMLQRSNSDVAYVYLAGEKRCQASSAGGLKIDLRLRSSSTIRGAHR